MKLKPKVKKKKIKKCEGDDNHLTSNKELNAPSSCDLFLEGVTLCLQVGGVAIQDVGVLWFNVYVFEEVIPHEGVVALGMIFGKPCVNFTKPYDVKNFTMGVCLKLNKASVTHPHTHPC